MKTISIKKFYSLKRKANMHFGKHSMACDEMLELIKPTLGIVENENCFVILQAGSGYVFTWEYKNSVVSTPVDDIIETFNISGRVLTEDDLLPISL